MLRCSIRKFAQAETVGVIGMGLMGHGIAQVSAMAGYNVVALDASPESLAKGTKAIDGSIQKLLARKVKKGSLAEEAAKVEHEQIMSRITPTTDIQALEGCTLVVEAIIENMEIKKPLYSDLARIISEDAVLATNTSSLSVQLMADALGRPQQVCGLHFFNPVQIMQLVEVIRTDQTLPSVIERANEFAKQVGKTPVQCKDTPGFVVNRILVPYIAQAMLLLDRGDADSFQEIDVAMKLGSGVPMGPFVLADYVGLDTILSVLEGWTVNFPNEPAFVVPDCLKRMCASGNLGRKTGQGFYKWEGDKPIIQ